MDVALIEVGLGLAVVFLIVATIADGGERVHNSTLNVRTKALWATISGFLANANQELPHIGLPFMFKAVGHVHRPKRSDGSKEAELLSTPSIRLLDYQRKDAKGTKVYHIPGPVFASALLELAKIKEAGGSLQERIQKLTEAYDGTLLGQYLASVADDVAEDADKFLDTVGDWFDAQMDRLQGNLPPEREICVGRNRAHCRIYLQHRCDSNSVHPAPECESPRGGRPHRRRSLTSGFSRLQRG